MKTNDSRRDSTSHNWRTSHRACLVGCRTCLFRILSPTCRRKCQVRCRRCCRIQYRPRCRASCRLSCRARHPHQCPPVVLVWCRPPFLLKGRKQKSGSSWRQSAMEGLVIGSNAICVISLSRVLVESSFRDRRCITQSGLSLLSSLKIHSSHEDGENANVYHLVCTHSCLACYPLSTEFWRVYYVDVRYLAVRRAFIMLNRMIDKNSAPPTCDNLPLAFLRLSLRDAANSPTIG